MRSKSARRGEQERCLELERLGLECKRHLVNGTSECAGGWAAGWLGRWRTVLRTRRRLEIERGGYSETGLGAKEDLKQAGWEARCERVALWPALGAARHGHTKPCCWNWSETVRDAPSDSINTTRTKCSSPKNRAVVSSPQHLRVEHTRVSVYTANLYICI